MNYVFSYHRYLLPFIAPVRTAHGRWSEREGVLIRLVSSAGTVTYGEAAPIPWFGTETTDEVLEACAQLGEAVDDARLDAVPAKLGCLRNALAMARREPGGLAEVAPRPVAALLPAGRAALALIEPKAEMGFRTFKWKVGVGDSADELILLDDVCALLPGGAKLRLDANGAWDRRTAERWLERCAERPIEFVEQPCFAKASQGAALQEKAEDLLLGLANDFPTPLALDESVINAEDVSRWLGMGWTGFYVVKPSLLTNAISTLAALEKARSKVVFSSALETAVGAKAALRLALLWNGSVHALGFGVGPLFADRVMNGPVATPFLRHDEVERIDEEAAWNALI